MTRFLRPLSRLAAAALAALVATSALAADPVEQHNSSALWFENWTGLSNATLTVTAPSGEVSQIRADSGTPVYQLGSEATDGVYRYELTAATSERETIVNAVDNGRGDAQTNDRAVPFYTSGRFVVERGVIITPEDVQEEDAG
ncbi:hypothetical protein [Roseivivax sediminis]|nr:hypothetical protein [Roseivivax sediminis]